jgi:hypothetical protein
MTYDADRPAVMAVISACSDSPFIDKTIDRRRRTPGLAAGRRLGCLGLELAAVGTISSIARIAVRLVGEGATWFGKVVDEAIDRAPTTWPTRRCSFPRGTC